MEFKNKYIYTQQMFREFVKYCKYRYLHSGIIFLTIMTVFYLYDWHDYTSCFDKFSLYFRE